MTQLRLTKQILVDGKTLVNIVYAHKTHTGNVNAYTYPHISRCLTTNCLSFGCFKMHGRKRNVKSACASPQSEKSLPVRTTSLRNSMLLHLHLPVKCVARIWLSRTVNSLKSVVLGDFFAQLKSVKNMLLHNHNLWMPASTKNSTSRLTSVLI